MSGAWSSSNLEIAVDENGFFVICAEVRISINALVLAGPDRGPAFIREKLLHAMAIGDDLLEEVLEGMNQAHLWTHGLISLTRKNVQPAGPPDSGTMIISTWVTIRTE